MSEEIIFDMDVRKWGSSKAIIIPGHLCKRYGVLVKDVVKCRLVKEK